MVRQDGAKPPAFVQVLGQRLRLELGQHIDGKYPGIDDSSTPEGQAYVQAINENPALLKNVYGPELAMYKMEEKLRTTSPVDPDAVDLEVQRRMRTNANAVPKASSSRAVGVERLREEGPPVTHFRDRKNSQVGER